MNVLTSVSGFQVLGWSTVWNHFLLGYWFKLNEGKLQISEKATNKKPEWANHIDCHLEWSYWFLFLLNLERYPVVMYGCESWTIKKAEHRRIDAFELWCWRRLESPLDCKEIPPVHPKGNESRIFIGKTDAEAETSTLWPPDAKSWLIWKDADTGKDWRQEKKWMTEDEMVGWHHRLNGHEFE